MKSVPQNASSTMSLARPRLRNRRADRFQRHAINKDLEVFLITAVRGLRVDMGPQRGRYDQESALAAAQLATRASENVNQVCQGQTFSGGERVRICLSS